MLIHTGNRILIATAVLVFINSPIVLHSEVTDKIRLQEWKILVTDNLPGSFIQADAAETGFSNFDGKSLPRSVSTNRMITLRSGFTIPDSLSGKRLSLYLGPPDYPLDIWLNGQRIFSYGSHGDWYHSLNYESYDVQLPESLLKPAGSANDIVFQLFPTTETQPLEVQFISTYREVNRAVFWRNLFNLHLVRSAVMVSILMGIYFLFLFASRKFSDLQYLYFALMCFFFCAAYSNMAFASNASPEIPFEKLSRSGFPLTTYFLALFIMEFTGYLRKNRLVKVLLTVPVLLAIGYTILMISNKSDMRVFFGQITTNLVITPLLVFSMVLLVIHLVRKRMLETVIILGAFVILIILSLSDMDNFRREVSPFCWMVPYGYLLLLVSIFATLAMEQSRLYAFSQQKALEIDRKNRSLRTVLEEIISVSEKLTRSSQGLEENVNTAVAVVESYGSSNQTVNSKLLEELKRVETEASLLRARIESSGNKIPRALASQTAVVEETNRTIESQNNHMETILSSARKTNDSAKELADIASKSQEMVLASRESIEKVSRQSELVSGILKEIREITEQSNFLALNASIESVRAGAAGKGFMIVAHEMRKLAISSKDNLTGSIERLRQMANSIEESLDQSRDVTERLLTIIDKSKQSAGMIQSITDLIHRQKEESSAILDGTGSLLKDTLSIRELSESEKNGNEQMKDTLDGLKRSFEEISVLLKTQSKNESGVHTAIANIRREMDENRNSIEALQNTVRKASVG